MLRELTRITDYYRTSSFVVDGDHLINQLLLHLNVSLNRDIESYVRMCGYETERLARVFRLVNPVVGDPKPYSGTFYNNDTKEFIILHANQFDFNKAYDDWEKLVPIKVHAHGFTDTACDIPDGTYMNSLSESGYAVISINLPMLALQYKAWVDKVNSKQEFKTQTVNYVYQYPITNMIWRHLDIAIVNRLITKYRGLPVAPYKRAHPIANINLDDRLDLVIARRLDIIKSGDYKFDQLFNIFECLNQSDWMTVLRPIDVAPVRSVKWVLELQVLNYFQFFLEVRRDANGAYNVSELTRALRDLRNLNNDATYFKSAHRDLDLKIGAIKTIIESD